MNTRNLLAIVSATILLLVSLGSRCGGGPPVISLTGFTPVASLSDDCDLIRLTRTEGQFGHPGSVVITLATGTGSPWWKEIKCEINGEPCGRLHANDGPSTAPGELFFAPHELRDARLIFTKPKTLGVATDVYQIIGLEGLANNRALFTWERDRCP